MNTPVKEGSWILGQNGVAKIKEISITNGGEGFLIISGISKATGKVINGGFYIDKESFTKAAIDYLIHMGILKEVFDGPIE